MSSFVLLSPLRTSLALARTSLALDGTHTPYLRLRDGVLPFRDGVLPFRWRFFRFLGGVVEDSSLSSEDDESE